MSLSRDGGLTDWEEAYEERGKELDALAERVRVLEEALTLACCDLAGTPVEAGRLTRGYLAAAATTKEKP